MERPILNPSVFDDPDRRPMPLMPREPWHAGRLFQQLGGALGHVLLAFWKLLWTPMIPRRMQLFVEKRSLTTRILAPVIFRLMILGVLLLATVTLIVYALAHPPVPAISGTPVTESVHIDPMSITSSDGVILDAYLAPAIDEKRVLKNGEVAVRAKWPAVVLVPDQRGDGHELDKLIPTLHERGYVVLLLRLRGTGDVHCAQTLGLHEKLDVAAAVTQVRLLKYIDSPRVSIVATGTGATAAMLARREDAGIEHVIVYNPIDNFDSILRDSVGVALFRPACRWAFEIIHQVDVEDLDRDNLIHELDGRMLMLAGHPARPPQREMIARYLQADPHATSAAR